MSEVVLEVYEEALPPVTTAASINSKVAPLIVQPESSTVTGNKNRRPLLREVEPWLPITESRKGNTWTATFHLISSGIGVQVLLLPYAFVKLGWYWGILSLSTIYVWQLYTTWLLVNLHESPNGDRYSRYLHISVVAFGQKLGKLLATFPVLYLSGGTCVVLIITGGAMLDQLYQLVACDSGTHCNDPVTMAEWFLIFICSAIAISQFFPNLNSLAWVSIAGSITAVSYCTLIWTLSVSKFKPSITQSEQEATSTLIKFRDVLGAIGILAFAFRGHNVMLEIQGTFPSSEKHQSKKPMWRGVIISYVTIAICLFPVAIGGYWAFGDELPSSGLGILRALTDYHQHHHASKWVLASIYMMVLIHYMCSFQIYAMVVFDNLGRIYSIKNNKPCSRWIRSGIKLFFGGLTYLISMAFPFLPTLGAFIGGIALPLTFAYPSFIWIAINRKENKNFHSATRTRMWYLNVVLGSLGVLMSVLVAAAALWSLVDNKLDANFFKPKRLHP